MKNHSRREFLSDVGSGMLIAGMGVGLATELGISTTFADSDQTALTFGAMESLVDTMQQTPIEKLQPILVKEMASGTPLKTLVAAGALANARSFGGQDYIGYHTMMALMPAWEIARELPEKEQALPILKVLYRNTARIHQSGASERLKLIESAKQINSKEPGNLLMKEVIGREMQSAERTFAAIAQANRNTAYNAIQHIVQDAPDVHRVTLAWRSWDVMQLTGYEHAHTLLRQSLRYCVAAEQDRVKKNRPEPVLRKLLPRLLDQYKLLSIKIGTRKADTDWIERMAKQLFAGSRDQAAETVAAALAEGYNTEDIGQAMSLAANLLILHDPGRPQKWASTDKPKNSVHGASVGVHASDAANAWRNIARVTNHRNQICSMIVGAWHTAGQTGYITDTPFAYDVQTVRSKKLSAAKLIEELHRSVQARDQAHAMAIVKSCELEQYNPGLIFNCLRQYAVSEDGALHAEKYFRTVTEEFKIAHKAFRWRHLIGLARVSASEFGWPAPGREQARDLLKV